MSDTLPFGPCTPADSSLDPELKPLAVGGTQLGKLLGLGLRTIRSMDAPPADCLDRSGLAAQSAGGSPKSKPGSPPALQTVTNGRPAKPLYPE